MESTHVTSTSGGLGFCRWFPGEPDEGLVMSVYSSNTLSSGKTKTVVVVADIRVVPVAVSRTAVPAVVDPRAAAQHTVIACSTFTPEAIQERLLRLVYTETGGCSCKFRRRHPLLSVPCVMEYTAA